MHPETLEPETARVLTRIAQSNIVAEGSGIYLAGGTALALQLGHRQSVDLDFFCEKGMSEGLTESLSALGSLVISRADPTTLDGLLDTVKVSFFAYSYPRLFPTVSFSAIPLADPRDIAAMKILAISQRCTRKDFIDLAILLRIYSLAEIFVIFDQKYKPVSYLRTHLLKSITYFVEAESEPMPRMFDALTWDEVKKILEKEACALAAEALADT